MRTEANILETFDALLARINRVIDEIDTEVGKAAGQPNDKGTKHGLDQ